MRFRRAGATMPDNPSLQSYTIDFIMKNWIRYVLGNFGNVSNYDFAIKTSINVFSVSRKIDVYGKCRFQNGRRSHYIITVRALSFFENSI